MNDRLSGNWFVLSSDREIGQGAHMIFLTSRVQGVAGQDWAEFDVMRYYLRVR